MSVGFRRTARAPSPMAVSWLVGGADRGEAEGSEARQHPARSTALERK